MLPNFLVLLGAALIPFIVAMGWFSKGLFGGENWTQIAGLSAEQAAKPVKPLKMLLTILLNFFVAFGIYSLAVHQAGVFSLVGGDAEMLKAGTAAAFLAEYGGEFLTFKHGAFHGIFAAIYFAVPLFGYVAIFERKGSKYFLVNVGYWLISMILMGGVIGQWGAMPVG